MKLNSTALATIIRISITLLVIGCIGIASILYQSLNAPVKIVKSAEEKIFVIQSGRQL